MTHGDRPEFCGVLGRKRLTYGAARSQAFPNLDSRTLKHRRVVRLKFSPPLN
jgi:hypothetical protein